MTLSKLGLQQPVVVLAAGAAASVQALQQQVGPRLATALGLPWHAPLEDHQPQQALAALEAVGPALVPLPVDPGLPLDGTGHWAEALGAWRQPVLLLLSGDQLQSGLPAAMVALLRQWQVPLLGLVQCGGSWEPAARRGDGLPWLGALEAPEDLAPSLALRWRQMADA